jgi:hypothetical protein
MSEAAMSNSREGCRGFVVGIGVAVCLEWTRFRRVDRGGDGVAEAKVRGALGTKPNCQVLGKIGSVGGEEREVLVL